MIRWQKTYLALIPRVIFRAEKNSSEIKTIKKSSTPEIALNTSALYSLKVYVIIQQNGLVLNQT